jgi:three-Cys-motif partner protein
MGGKSQLENVLDFFREKRPWSKYKDLILDYYLEPYLQKVKILRKPILVVDCFAGPGKFDDDQFGSPLIILEKLQKLSKSGYPVTALFIESNKELYARLERNTRHSIFPIETRNGDFNEFVDEISSLASNHSVFIYLDPIKPSHLHFDQMRSVYEKLQTGQSVEVLINFMSWGFLRGVWGSANLMMSRGKINPENPYIIRFNKIAGGTYWQIIAFDDSLSQTERTDKLADGYASQLHHWFKYVLTYPIREKYETSYPKYHLVFGSRSHHAVDLMNRAMVKARREFIKAGFIDGFLFPNQPEKEVIRPEEIKKMIIGTCRKLGRTDWTRLRINATISYPSLYTDSEFNRAIKQAIKNGDLASNCPGTKIEENALIWPIS